MGTLRYDGLDYPVEDPELVALQFAIGAALREDCAFVVELRTWTSDVTLVIGPGIPVTLTVGPNPSFRDSETVDRWERIAGSGGLIEVDAYVGPDPNGED